MNVRSPNAFGLSVRLYSNECCLYCMFGKAGKCDVKFGEFEMHGVAIQTGCQCLFELVHTLSLFLMSCSL